MAAVALKLTAPDMLKNKLIDGIVKEPVGGAHTSPEIAFKNTKVEIQKHLEALSKLSTDKLLEKRMNKFSSMGVTK